MNIFLGKPSYDAEVFIINNNTKWKWTNVRDCPDKLLDILNGPDAPKLQFRIDKNARPPYKGFWTLDEVKYDDWRFLIWLEYGMGTEKTVMLTELGYYKDEVNP